MIITIYFVVIYVPFFYEIIGQRLENLYEFFISGGTSEGSINTRADMINWGWKFFWEKPIFGYGIDNYKFLYGFYSSEGYIYSHNNVIELLVGTGLVGTILYYAAHLIVVKDLFKASKLISKSLCFCFIVIIIGYILMSVGMVYYYDKHISIILAVGSVVFRIAKNESDIDKL